jgi:membrane protein implicated in regulation of membrane protease activity
METMIKILRFFWIGIAALTFISSIFFFVVGAWRDGLSFLALALISCVMIWLNKKREKLYVKKNVQPDKKTKKN